MEAAAQETPPQAHSAAEPFAYAGAPLRTVMEELQARTGFRFLYRDALVAGVTVTLKADSANVLSSLSAALEEKGLRLHVDQARWKVLVAPAPQTNAAPDSSSARGPPLTGYVVDAKAGRRLAGATVTWQTANGQRRGAVADASGRVRLRLTPGALPERVVLTASHVGYAPAAVTIVPGDPPAEVTFRLTPRSAVAPGVTVRTVAFPTALDTTWQGLTQPDLFTPLGEPSVMRSLQLLPSVAITDALSGGLHVRGSPANGFHVLLDGVPIYNQTHLFGLFDAFNDEALQTVGFFADVVPAQYRAPPGGTLAFETRPGSQATVGATGTLSSTAVSATAEGPLWDGRGSWMLSARRSYLDVVNWLGNGDLIAQGLGTDVRTGTLPERTPTNRGAPSLDPVSADPPTARFYDVHGALAHEWPSGHRLRLSAYAGGDYARQAPDPISLTSSGTGLTTRENNTQGRRAGPAEWTRPEQISLQPSPSQQTPVERINAWDNETASIQWDAPLTDGLVSRATLGLSRYSARLQEDLAFPIPSAIPELGTPLPLGTRRAENRVVDGLLRQRLSGTAGVGTWTAGYLARLVDVRYRERLGTAAFTQRRRSGQVDLFGQYDRSWLEDRVEVRLGLRAHGFLQGRHGRLSPRIWVQARPPGPWTVTAGYTRNHQFLHRLSGGRAASADVWVMSSNTRPPAVADHVTFGVGGDLTAHWALQVKGFYKSQRHARLRLPAASGAQGLAQAPPWATGTLAARGIEGLHRLQGALPVAGADVAWTWTTSYALSRADVNIAPEGGRQAAPWDRRHQGATRLQVTVNDRWSAHLTWLGATGRPNQLRRVLPGEPERLGLYHRLDAALEYRQDVGTVTLTARAAVLNAYDRDNPRYRQLVLQPLNLPAPESSVQPRPRPERAAVDVYDLGIRPSFALSVAW
jgi:hypothetical protein